MTHRRQQRQTVAGEVKSAAPLRPPSSLKAPFDLMLRPLVAPPIGHVGFLLFGPAAAVSDTAVTSVGTAGHRVQCDEGGGTFSTLNEQSLFKKKKP